MYRYNYSLSQGLTRTEREIFFTNIITGYDLGYFFNRWGFYLNNEGIFVPEKASEAYLEKMKEYINSGKIKENKILKLWYLDYKEYMFIVEGGEGCYENQEKYSVEIEKVFYINKTRTVIFLPKINCKGHLGFEIYEKDKLLGFTYDTIYIDTTGYENNNERSYKIIAYDRKLNPSKESAVKNIEANSNVCSYNSIKYNSIKEAIESSTEDEVNIYLIKDTYEGMIEINKKVNIYIDQEINNRNITIYKIDSGNLFHINENAFLKIEGRNNNNKIILDGMNIYNKGNLIYGFKSTFTGNYVDFQNLNNSEVNGGAIYTQSCMLNLNNSLIMNNYASNGGGIYTQLISGKTMVANIENVIFENNKGQKGAAIKNTGTTTLNKCEIKNCYASNYGGGIANDEGGILNLNNVRVYGNLADNMGGGLYLDGATNLNNVIISGNNANIGAGIAYIGGNDRRVLNVEAGTDISQNTALKYAGGIYIKNGIVNLNGGDLYENIIKTDEKIEQSNSDLLYIENGKVNINSIKFDGNIYKSDLGTIYLKSTLLKHNENSKIYIDFPINGINKTLILPLSYTITTEDLSKISLIDTNSGRLELVNNNIEFSPKILNIIFNTVNLTSFQPSFLEETEKEEIYYYGKSLSLTETLFKVKENEYITKIYDKEGNNYSLGETIKLKSDIEFIYLTSYKNKIIFDFIDYIEEKLVIPDDYLYMPAFSQNYSTDKEILYWKDFNSNNTIGISEKISAKENKTFVAIYSNNGNNYMVQIYAFGINYYSKLVKYKERIYTPEIIIPKNNHLIGWMDLFNNMQYEINITDSLITKDYYLVAIIIGYVNYYISDKLVIQKSYNINSTFSILNQNDFPNNQILFWEDKITKEKYFQNKEYILEGDIDLIAILETKQEKGEEEKSDNTALIVCLSILGAFIVLVVVYFVYRHYRLKKWTKVNLEIIELMRKEKAKNNLE